MKNLKLIFQEKINDDLYSEIKSNLLFAGLMNTSINNEHKEIISTTKEWPNNKLDEYKDLDVKNINGEGKGVDASHLIDPFTTYQPNLKYYPLANAKPCKNCTCGRAANNENMNIKTNSGGCGRCHLGDEFRCANCPYRGLPAFNTNDNNNNQISENQEIEKVKLEVKDNNVVKIDI